MLFTQEFAGWTPVGYVITLAVFAMALLAVAVVYAKLAEHGAFLAVTFHLLFAVLSAPLAIFVLVGINALLPLGSSNMEEAGIIFLALVYLLAALLVAPFIGRSFIEPRKERGEQT